MPSHTFRWTHSAQQVFVTGTFDNWSKSEKLDRSGSGFEKTVSLPEQKEKILYKFLADGEWKHDHTAKTETDHQGNINNVLYPSDIQSHLPNSANSVASIAAIPAMAGHSSSTPGAFPETPAPSDNQMFNVNPLPGTSGSGNPVSLQPHEQVPAARDITSNTIGSNVKLDEESYNKSDANPIPRDNQTFSVNPLPATGGTGNPVSLAPGEKVPEPSSFTSNTVGSNIKLDEASYNKSDAGAPFLPPALSPDSEKEAFGEKAIFGGLGPQTTNMIPESSMGMGRDAAGPMDEKDLGPHISSVGPGSTTAQLAGSQPLEHQRSPPEIVTESQQAANADPEASASPRALEEKDQVENELTSKVPEAPAAAESSAAPKSSNGMFGMAAGGLAAVGTAAAGYAYTARDKTTAATGKDPMSFLPQSMQAANVAPEASASPRALERENQTESEVTGKGPEAPAAAKSTAAPKSGGGMFGMAAGGLAAAGTAAAGYAYSARDKTTAATGKDPMSFLPQSVQDSINNMNTKGATAPLASSTAATSAAPQHAAVNDSEIPQQTHVGDGVEPRGGTFEKETTSTVPEEVLHSQKEAHFDPEAAASPVAVEEKSAVEKELLEKVPTTTATGEPAPTLDAGSSTAGGSSMPTSGMSAAGFGAAGLGAAGLGAAGLGAAGMASHEHGAAGGVPETVTESQREANFSPEAAAVPEAVQEKSAVEDELLTKVPTSTATGEPAPTIATEESAPAPAAREPTSAPATGGSGFSAAGMGAMGLGAAGVGAAGLGAAGMAAIHHHGAASGVPEPVVESQRMANFSPEAAAVPEAVQEKSAVENELLSKIPTSTATGVPAPVVASAAALTSTTSAIPLMSSGAPQLSAPTAGLAALSMNDKSSIPSGISAGATSLNAPASASAIPLTQTPAAAAAPTSLSPPIAAAAEEPVRSRDVSPMTKIPTQASTATTSNATPVVAAGVGSPSAPAAAGSATAGKPIGTPRPNVVGGASTSTPAKRQSFAERLRGTPESGKSSGGAGDGKEGKKRGLFKRLADKLK
ncbi:Cruciform DNA binding protein [Friedmanniomyces endolithicus]|uniref:Cruciform DNA binding protein n=1 Tax=Friedmanniomyces endolithicus TaxID=329885 RepID=A0AAN6JC67_9PEZI|nr:Cruciform DNA binding protein [Friedmanniomyces endolithicus]KAK0300140.1 Cruciform DNA binding protein [Friedmanniomyces endolithicus]KAK0325057.1 Cruciform DNA binding protein [Friedmanniomyces endolithicus]KAK0999445.1 Cruciform DNA binding protein [Friedmanniomyces endolithicus]